MTHSARAPHLHVEIIIERLDRGAQRLAELVAAIAGGRRVLHDVDRERNDPAGPRGGLPEHQRQRHRQAVVDVHLVDDRQVKIALDHRLRDVGRELGMSLDDRHRSRPPALVGGRKALGAADCERRDDIEAERRCVVVVDQQHYIGPAGGDPALGEIKSLEHLGPVRIARAAIVERRTDGGDMRGRDAGGDPSHAASRR